MLFFVWPAVIFAQPVPKLTSVSPEWIQRGTTVDMVFTGENLGGVTGFIFNGDPGLSATHVRVFANFFRQPIIPI